MITNRRTRGHLMRAALIALVALILGGLTGHVAAHAETAPCVPTAGQDYIAPTYATEAEYTRTIPGTGPIGTETIPNPDHIPATTTTIDHPAEYATDHLYTKQVRGIIQQRTGWGGWQDTGQTFDWETWTGNLTRWEAADFTETGPHSAVQSTDGKKRKLTTEYRYVQTGETRQGVKTRDAWTETVTTPGNGLPATIPNPDYKPGTDPTTETLWSETAPEGDGWTATGNTRSGEGVTRMTDPGQPHIDPVTCPDDTTPPTTQEPGEGDDDPTPVTDPAPTATPVASPVTVTPALAAADPAAVVEQPTAHELAYTGTSVTTGALVATVLVLAGGLLLAARHRRTTR